MLLSDFIAARAEHRQRAGLALMLALFLMGIYVAVLLTHIGGVTAFVLHHFSPSTAGAAQGSLMFPTVFILLLTIWLFDRKSNHDSRLRCFHCGKRLDTNGALVIATKNCFHCGKTVLSEEA